NELSDKELNQIEADDQAIQTILLGLSEDIYAAVDSCETAQEIWLRVQQMMKGSDIGIQEKKAKNKNFPEKIATDYTQLYDFLKYNQKEVDELKAERLAKTQDPLALMANSNNPYEQAGIQLQAEEYDLMAVAANLDKIEEVNANCILMANLQQASTSGTQIDSAPVYDTDGSAEVHENCDDNEIFNMFTQEEQYTELLEPIPESHQVPQNDNDVISEDTSVEQDKLLDKQIQLEKRIKELNKIVLKTSQSIQMIHMLSPKPNLFYHTKQKMALGYQNPFYLKQAQKKQQSLYDGKVLLEKHDPPVVHDSEETL
nr:hypothetical protein [Tanacetum cinerariifolium]